MELHKNFNNYHDAYALYSDIVSGRDANRKNASIIFKEGYYCVMWEAV